MILDVASADTIVFFVDSNDVEAERFGSVLAVEELVSSGVVVFLRRLAQVDSGGRVVHTVMNGATLRFSCTLVLDFFLHFSLSLSASD